MIMLTKTNELTGAALDWAVAIAEGLKPDDIFIAWHGLCRRIRDDDGELTNRYMTGPDLLFSRKWEAGGPIIEREITKVFRNVGGTWSAMVLKDVSIPPEDRGTSLALTRRAQWNGAGPTLLIAAMRCYVASKLGNEVDIPKELL